MAETWWALKEWAVAVDALLNGELVLLVRKGGIREARPYFEVPSDRALLFPTYEHQKSSALRDPRRSTMPPGAVPQVGASLSLRGWAAITQQLPLTGTDIVERLHPFHIWTADWLAERLAWKPERPAYALLLRVHRFQAPLTLTYEQRFGGCRSWLELADLGNLPKSAPVLTDATYEDRVTAIQQAIAPVTVSAFPPR